MMIPLILVNINKTMKKEKRPWSLLFLFAECFGWMFAYFFSRTKKDARNRPAVTMG